MRQWPGSHLEDGGEGGLRPIEGTLACEKIGGSHKGQNVLLNSSGKDGLN